MCRFSTGASVAALDTDLLDNPREGTDAPLVSAEMTGDQLYY